MSYCSSSPQKRRRDCDTNYDTIKLMTVTLGIKPYGHDTSATIVMNGVIIAAIAEERFNREKHSCKFPKSSIRFCIDQSGISDINTIDEISVCFDYLKLVYHLNVVNFFKYFPVYTFEAITNSIYQLRKIVDTNAQFKRLGYTGKVRFLNHHDCHAASTYYTSTFTEAAIITVDGRGEHEATCIYSASGANIKKLTQVNYPNSLGAFYSCITEFLGFKENEDEGKVMGLAPYGDLSLVEAMNDVLKVGANGYELDLSYFYFQKKPSENVSKKFVSIFGQPRNKDDELTQHHMNIARAAQDVLEKALLALAKKAKDSTGASNLCISGGVALNSVGNGKIAQAAIFDSIFIYPAAGDDGASAGAALLSYYSLRPKERVLSLTNQSPYLGPDFLDKNVEAALTKYSLSWIKPTNLEDYVAALLADNKFVGWYQGRAEFGPRALGNRSILANPRLAENKDHVNERIKFREHFRPFAPSTTLEDARNYFELGTTKESPYMILAFNVKKDKQIEIPAVTHVDGTARVQTVTQEGNLRYWKLLKAFQKQTGTPVLMNTSFNIMGEPIVNTPEQAVKCFLGCGLDTLVIGDYVISKE